MDVRERIRVTRLIEKVNKNAEYADRLGIVTFNARRSNTDLPVETEIVNQERTHKGE